MRQQGFADDASETATLRFRGLQFQPTIVGTILLAAIVLQSPATFLAVSAVLGWNALAPKANPFELAYNRWIARPRGRPPLQPAPGPRRFAQGMAAAFALAAGSSLLLGWTATAYVFQALLAVAFVALLFGKFCLGAYVYHLLRGNASFANATCPWS
ncbi:MAG: DUF4395 family protein [Gemmatimonadota bacterium]